MKGPEKEDSGTDEHKSQLYPRRKALLLFGLGAARNP